MKLSKKWAKKIVRSLAILIVVILSFSIVFSSSSLAAVNQELNFQSKIVNTNGTNVTPSTTSCVKSGADTCDFRVSVYSDSSGGTALWSEIHTDVEIGNDSILKLSIGSYCISNQGGSWTTDGDGVGTRCTVSGGGVDWGADSTLYLQVEFDVADTAGQNSFSSPEVFTRKLITSVPFAQKAGSADHVRNVSGVIYFNDVNTGEIAFSDTTYTALPGGMNSILHALNAASGGGGGLWTINGDVTYLTSTGSDLSLSSTLVSAFSVDKSENLIRFGDGSAGNAKLDFFSQSGETARLEYTNSDILQLSGGDFKIVDNTSAIFGTDNDIEVAYVSANNRLELSDGTNLLAYLTDNGTTGTLTATGNLVALGGNVQSGSSSQTGGLRLYDGSSNSVLLTVPGIASDYTLTLPTTDGDANQVLRTDGSGALSWVSTDFTLAGGTGTPQTISSGNTLTIAGGTAIVTSTSDTDTLTVAFNPNANLDINGQWEFQDSVAVRFGTDADFHVSFNGTNALNFTDGTNNLFSIIDLGTTARIRLGSGTNDLFGTTAAGSIADGDLYWGNDLLCDVSETNCGWASITGSSKWTDGGDTTYLTDTADNLAIGGVDDTSPFFFNVEDDEFFISNDASINFGDDGRISAGDGGALSVSDGSGTVYVSLHETLGASLNAGVNQLGVTGSSVGLYANSGHINMETTGNVNILTDGGVFIRDNANANLSLVNTTTGADANSGYLIFQGNDWNGSSNTTLTMRSQLVITSTTDYRTGFFNNALTEVASLDESGNFQIDGRLNIGTNTLDLLGVSAASAANGDLYWGDKLVCDASETNCGWATTAGSSKWTDGGAISYLTETTDDLAVGGSTSAAPFFFDTSAGRLALNVDGSGGGLVIGTDTQLYRSATNTLRTPDSFTVDGNFLASGTGTITGLLTTSTNGIGGGIVIGSDTQLYRSNTNLLRTPDAFTVDGAFTGSAGATIAGGAVNITGGNLIVQNTTPFNIILDNSTVGADANSGVFVLRGNDWDGATNTEIEMGQQLIITSTTDYRIAFLNDAGTEIGSIDEGGNLQIDGRFNLGTDTADVLSIGTAGAAANGDLYWGEDLLCDVSESNCGWSAGGGSLLTDAGAITYLTQTADDFAIGGTGLNSSFSVDVSANTVRIGTGTTANAVLQMFASDGDTGNITYGTNDRWEFIGGDLLIGDDQRLFMGTDTDFFMVYDETTDDRLEFGFGANQFGSIDNVAAQTYGRFEFTGVTVLGAGLTGTETALLVNTGAGFTGKLLDLNINGTDIFEVSATGIRGDVPATFATAGNVQIANNLEFTNSVASYITSQSPLYVIAGDIVSSEDLILKANNEGYVIIDDRLDVTDKISIGNDPSNLLATTAAGAAATNNLYWGNKLLCDTSKTNCGNAFSIAGNLTYLDPTTQDFAVGGSSLTASFSIDSSENLMRLGVGSGTNARIDLFASNGNSVRFEMTTADVLELNNGGFHFNQAGDAVDFVIEGDTDANLFTADGSADSIGVGIATPGAKLHIVGTSDNEGFILDAWSSQTEDLFKIRNSSANNLIVFTSLGGAIFNEQGADADFRIESTSNANMFFVDASTNRVGIGTNTPGSMLHVNGSFGVGIQSMSSSGSVGDVAVVFVDTTGGAVVADLPQCSGTATGRMLTINQVGGDDLVLDPFSSEQINNSSILVFTDGATASIVCDGTQWRILYLQPATF
ncbi:MAG: hypothetical protein QY314_02805 [Candidatus Dojkabacteria bacterium]|nr:MAG: hypothetical protein QY314_02805 [Candidatus Dojkabacteria bacterium]